ncbi:hypothetical protein FHETE_3125 [Fusarium heterosporum]|uniref:F-box domain-containing protein n=1 Tax=Fusarium heterosporum TaxID=42747 RepID=A0A8H5TKU5_FUSHE|nr:hypothetical protein FHETE_3125 [Fusarium heterosporum]
MESSNAVQQILFVPELLELILLHLDMKTLLVSASRVCRQWAAIMAKSPRIQQALFFQPALSTTSGRPRAFTLNPLLVEKFGRCFFDIDRKYTYLRRADSFFRLPWAPEGAIAEQGLARSLSVLEKTRRLENFTMSSSSWRRMLVSQPPPLLLGYLKLDVVEIWFHEVYTALIEPRSPSQGLSMGQLYDMVHSTTCQRENYATWYRISWDKPRGSHQTERCREECEKLLDQTNVMVEFYSKDAGEDWDCGPWDISSVREAFRCGDCCSDKVENLVEAELEMFEPLGLDMLTSVWWHDEEDGSAVDVEGYGYSEWP